MNKSSVLPHIFNAFHLDNLKGDVYGGLTAAVVSLPMALAFGVASGAGAEAGLYGAVLVGLFAAVFGGTSTLISEPTGPMTVVMTAVLTTMLAQNPEQGFAMAFTVVIIAGTFQILLGLLKLGKYITLMPYSVISGFMSGIGIILMVLQLAPLLGQATPAGGVTGTLSAFPELITKLQPFELILGLFTLAILFFSPKKINRIIPPQLLALILGTGVSLIFFTNADIRRIGEISLGLPSIQLPVFTQEQFTAMLLDGLVLGTLGCIDSLLTAMISDSLTRQEHRSDKELIGQGIGNIVSGLFGGLPGAGATMGTVVNIQAGAKTALSGVVRAIILIVVIYGAASLTKNIPLAVLAGIAFKVGLNILDWSFMKRAHEVSKTAAFIMLGVLLLTVFFDLIVAVGLGVFIANIITIDRLSKVQMQNVRAISDAADDLPLTEEEKALLDQGGGNILLVHLSGPMIFGVSKAISREHKTMERFKSIVLDFHDVPIMDATISLAMENTVISAIENGKKVFIVRPQSEAKKILERTGIFGRVPSEQLHDSRVEALRCAAQDFIEA